MNRLKLTLLATAAMGAASIGGASAMPFSNLAGAVESDVQNARVVCNRNGKCYNTRVNRARPYYAQRYRGNRGYYAAPYAPGYGYGAYGYGGPRVGVGVGPFGFGVW
jgi:hypothetical protein